MNAASYKRLADVEDPRVFADGCRRQYIAIAAERGRAFVERDADECDEAAKSIRENPDRYVAILDELDANDERPTDPRVARSILLEASLRATVRAEIARDVLRWTDAEIRAAAENLNRLG